MQQESLISTTPAGRAASYARVRDEDRGGNKVAMLTSPQEQNSKRTAPSSSEQAGTGVNVQTTCTALQDIGNLSDRCHNWRSAAGGASIAPRPSYSPGRVELPESVTIQAWFLVPRDYLWLSHSHYGAMGKGQACEQITSNRPHLCKIWHLPHEMSDLRHSLFIMAAEDHRNNMSQAEEAAQHCRISASASKDVSSFILSWLHGDVSKSHSKVFASSCCCCCFCGISRRYISSTKLFQKRVHKFAFNCILSRHSGIVAWSRRDNDSVFCSFWSANTYRDADAQKLPTILRMRFKPHIRTITRCILLLSLNTMLWAGSLFCSFSLS